MTSNELIAYHRRKKAKREITAAHDVFVHCCNGDRHRVRIVMDHKTIVSISCDCDRQNKAALEAAERLGGKTCRKVMRQALSSIKKPRTSEAHRDSWVWRFADRTRVEDVQTERRDNPRKEAPPLIEPTPVPLHVQIARRLKQYYDRRECFEDKDLRLGGSRHYSFRIGVDGFDYFDAFGEEFPIARRKVGARFWSLDNEVIYKAARARETFGDHTCSICNKSLYRSRVRHNATAGHIAKSTRAMRMVIMNLNRANVRTGGPLNPEDEESRTRADDR